jgi:hypothetical protein
MSTTLWSPSLPASVRWDLDNPQNWDMSACLRNKLMEIGRWCWVWSWPSKTMRPSWTVPCQIYQKTMPQRKDLRRKPWSHDMCLGWAKHFLGYSSVVMSVPVKVSPPTPGSENWCCLSPGRTVEQALHEEGKREEEIWFNGTSTQKGHIVPEVW